MNLVLKIFIIICLPVVVWGADHKILFLGDSQSAGFLGRIIFDHLIESHSAENVNVYGVSASSPRHWGSPQKSWSGNWLCNRKGRHNTGFEIPLKSKICGADKNKSALEHLMSDATHVVFQFLGNSTQLEEEMIKRHLQNLLKKIGKRKCVFITSPPHFHVASTNKRRKEVEDLFVKTIGDQCQVSRGMSGSEIAEFSKEIENYLKDRVHLSRKGAQRFFELKVKGVLPK